jgi:predicted GIY-YIG superfamily endonuclease
MHERYYYTYVVASRSLTLYIGMTGDLDKGIFKHKNKLYEGFSATYNCDRLGVVRAICACRQRDCARKTIEGMDESQEDCADQEEQSDLDRFE